VATVAVLTLLVTVFLVGRSPSPPLAGAAGTTTTTTTTSSTPTSIAPITTSTASTTPTLPTAPVSGFYLDIGGSASLGFQPDGVPHHDGHRTNEGYANDVKALEDKNVSLDLLQLGCPGETVQSMLGLLKNTCYHLPVTQLMRSVDALTGDGNEVGLVTIDLGFNNIRPCLLPKTVEQSCVNQAVTLVRQYLPRILKDLQDAAGPNVYFVGLEYEDPFLGYYLEGSIGPTIATETLVAMSSMNAALNEVYTKANIPIANVPGAYQSDNDSPRMLANVGTIPQNVDTACLWTWICTPPPFGPDDHPNNAGYMIIARAIVATLPKKW
jgi:lysophospholipase L1-like esterase